MVLEDAGDVVGLGGDLDDPHASHAAFDGAGRDLYVEHTLEQPRPGVTRGRGRRQRWLLARLEEWQLWRRAPCLAARHDLGAHGGVGGEHAVVAEHVEARRRDEGAEPRDEVEGVEQHGVGAKKAGTAGRDDILQDLVRRVDRILAAAELEFVHEEAILAEFRGPIPTKTRKKKTPPEA